jgi:hypothetical protein
VTVQKNKEEPKPTPMTKRSSLRSVGMMIISRRLRRRGRSNKNPSNTLYWMARVVLWGLVASYTGYRYRSLWVTFLHDPFVSSSMSSSAFSYRLVSHTKDADALSTTKLLPSCTASLELIPLVTSNYTSHFPMNKLMMSLQGDSFASSSSSSFVERGAATTAEEINNNNQANLSTTPVDFSAALQHHYHHHSAICVFSWHNDTNPQGSSIPFLHFPHTMQIMYRCWSWWQQQQQQVQQQYQFSFQNSDISTTAATGSVVGVDVSWILLLPNQKVKDKLMGLNASDFNRGFFTSLEQFANVSIQVSQQEDNNNNPHNTLQRGRIEKNHVQKSRLRLAPTSNNDLTSSSTTITTTSTTTSSTSMAGPFQSGSGRSYQVASPHHLSRLRDIFVSGFLDMNRDRFQQNEKKVPPPSPTRVITRRRTQKGTTTTTTLAAPSVVVVEEVLSETITTTTPATATTNAFPRIAIVNREGYRKLVNAYEIAKEVEQRLAVLWKTTNSSDSSRTVPSSSSSSSSSRNMPGIVSSSPSPPSTTSAHPISLVSFDGWSFADQVLFMNSVDVIISPHGAQLTSIPFLPPCASILELFPQGYHPPYYFGTLAAASGITHSYTSLTRGYEHYFKEEIQIGMANATNRNTCRNVQLCPPVLDLVEQIMTVIQQWHERCVVEVS